MKKVAVFGGASALPGDSTYAEAQRLGRMLAERGYTVQTGGYIGVMEAASRGANEAGGHVIGVTCEEIESWRGVAANRWVKEELRHETLRDRMYALIDSSDAAIVMPGGVGTLCELAVMWNEMIISNKPVRPLIIVGSEWRKALSQLLESLGGYVGSRERELIQLVPDVDSAVEKLVENEQ